MSKLNKARSRRATIKLLSSTSSLVLAGIILLPTLALGAPAADGFAYAVGPLTGNNGGSGWGGAWNGADIDVVASSLAHPGGGLPTSGGATQLDPPLPFAPAQVVRDLGSNLGDADETIWVSFLVKPQDLGATSYMGITLGTAGTAALPDNTRLFFGYYGTNFNLNTWGHLTANVDVPGVVSGQTAFLVLKLDILASGNETATLYVNPTPGLAAPDVAASAPKSDVDLGVFNKLTIGGGRLFATNPSELDEIRLGSTYLSVAPSSTPTPTPTPYGDVTSQGITFPGVTLNGQDQQQTGSTSAWSVTSTYPAGTGWHITVEGNDFSDGTHTIPIGNLETRLLDANVVVISGSGPPSSTMTSYTAVSTTAQTMLQATGANGEGEYEFTPDFRLSIPAEAFIGTYTASITATFIVGP